MVCALAAGAEAASTGVDTRHLPTVAGHPGALYGRTNLHCLPTIDKPLFARRNGVCTLVARIRYFSLPITPAESQHVIMPNELESDVVIVQTNHGLIYAVPVPPQSFEENSSNTLEHAEPVESVNQSPQMVG